MTPYDNCADTKPVLDRVAQVLREVDEEGADPVEAIGLIREAVEKSDGEHVEPAFPSHDPDGVNRVLLMEHTSMHFRGMSLRDWFAGQAMAALISKFPLGDRMGEYGMPRTQAQIDEAHRDIACSAFGYADAMLAERKHGGAA